MLEVQEYAEIFEKNPIPHGILDKDLKILLVNEPLCRLLGYGRETLIGLPLSDIKNKNMIRYIRDSGGSILDALSGKVSVGESTMETPSGIHTVIRTNIPLLDEKGNVKYIYINYNDITKVIKKQEYMAREVEELQKMYARMAKGDLTLRYDITQPDEDTKDVYEQIILLRDAVRGIIGSLQNNIRDVNDKMNELTRAAEVTSVDIGDAVKSLHYIAEKTASLSSNAEKSAQNIEEVLKAMGDMSATIEEIASSMESVSNLSRETNNLSRKGAQLAGDTEKSMADIAASTAQVSEIVSKVERQMNEITKIVSLIRDLANQTNLLALNAAIEAARAGDAGRGFAVVATEVKALAQESGQSAEKIEGMINNLNKETLNATQAMKAAKAVVETGSRMVTETLQAFMKIADSIDHVAKSAEEVASATEEQAAATEEITATVNEVARIVDQTAKEATGIAAAVEESTSSMDEISTMANKVNAIAAEALAANKRFKVE
ncbi:MAG: methyl-accepting chemotaxis protein [Methanolinea sp.]|jgi:methyl-accepting chemotaxis protein|nr:methyl-accepting chemotaxis protein [Methanolinea sp.]